MSNGTALFDDDRLSPALISALGLLNPWWEGAPAPAQPETRRHLVAQVRRRVETEIAPVVVVRGPRQTGKTTIQFQMIQDLLAEGVPPTSILRVQFDELEALGDTVDPIIAIADWFQRNVASALFNRLVLESGKAYLFFDEIQNLRNWHVQLKSLVDSAAVKVIAAGSSALRIERGRDSLAGRITTVDVGVLSLTEIGAFRQLTPPAPYLKDNATGSLKEKKFWTGLREYGLEHVQFRRKAFRWFSERGGYPIVHKSGDIEWSELADQLNETVVKRVIVHDLRQGDRGREPDPQLLEELFRLCCRYAGQSPAVSLLAEEVRMTLNANIKSQRVGHYLRFLDDTLLLRLVSPLEIRLKRKRGSPKICLVDHGLRASWLEEYIPLDPEELAPRPELTTLAGHLAESVFGSVASTVRGLDIAHFPARGTDREVDFVLTVGDRRIPVEVKYQRRVDPERDTRGIRSFLEKTVSHAMFGVLVTQGDNAVVDDPRIVCLPLSSFMLLK